MTEFVKICAVMGLFTVYMMVTGIPGVITYCGFKNDKIETRLWKSILVSYIIGLIIAVTMGAYFMVY